MSPIAKHAHLLAGVFDRIPTILIFNEASTTPLRNNGSLSELGRMLHLISCWKKIGRFRAKMAQLKGLVCFLFFFVVENLYRSPDQKPNDSSLLQSNAEKLRK
jgi:hypothetical protein